MTSLFSRNGHKKISLRPFQEEAVAGTKKQWSEGRRKVIICQPTGSGKTVVAGSLIDEEVKGGSRCLIVADRKKLCRQFAYRVEQDFGIQCSIEMGSQKEDGTPVVAATVQTLTNRLNSGRFHPEEFSLLVFEEAHLALGDGFQKVANHFENSRIIGLTATPRASRQRDLMTFFDAKGADIPLSKLIKEGYLSPLKIVNAPIQITVNAASKTGDYTDEEISSAIEPYLQRCAESMVEHCRGRCSLAFLPLIKTSKMFVEMLCKLGIKAEHVDGEMKEKDVEAIKKKLEMGTIDCVCCSMLWTVGIDIKPVNFICNLRCTRSWVLFAQTCGRGTRLFDPEIDGPRGTKWPKKTECILFDPVWNTDEHNLLQRPSCLVATNEEEAKAIDKKLMANGEDAEFDDLLEAQVSVLHERELALKERLEAMQRRKSREVDAMELFLDIGRADLAEYSPISKWEMEPMTPGQRQVLSGWGVDLDTITSKGMASQVIDTFLQRHREGFPSIKQCRYAQSLGLLNPWIRTKEEVSRYIESVKSGKQPFKNIPA